ncbi:GNAT family N-acetyltransferase [Halomonas sp. ML-15]|uniref:GNAT family N-acetyltransferase n=1 Tax=Halomonas sp. ML-15 TaxID=2773305 RepID=UPI0017470625|nr:GNAT family N-acetyltransferase [Halomonas sp. ML-15]MBD3895793.1 GNAT family N-acetyltransferase [Halomonas sp. ML-15]
MSDATSIEQGDWEELGSEAGEIRRIVFIVEQQVPENEEWDGRDTFCLHFLARHEGRALGTARLLPDGHLGRVAVLEEGRGLGLGRRLVEAAIEAARHQGHAHLELAAQLQAIPFYQRLGFTAYGDEFLDAGIPHRNMSLPLGD